VRQPAAVYDVTEQSFEQEVIERSRSVPVVVDFWAPWCGPCRMLGPMLESLVRSYDGRIELAKLNTDEAPNLAYRYRIDAIPAVKGFRDGEVVDEFSGALPEPQVRAFLQRLLPSEADHLAERAARQAYGGDPAGAEASYRQALDLDPAHRSSVLGLARLLLAREETDEALELLRKVPGDSEASRLLAEIAFSQAAQGADAAALRARLQNDPRDVDALYRLAMVEAARGEYEPALQRLLEVVRLDRSYGDDAGRRGMLDIFTLLSDAHPLTQTYRRQLSYVLF
jgi:putative thioredoxin